MTQAATPRPRNRHHARDILRLGLPLIGNNLAIAGMGAVDTLMAGQLGAQSLGAVAVGSSYYHLFLLVGLGILMALSSLVAHARGAGRTGEVASYAQQGLWLALGMAVVLVPLMLCAGPVLRAIHTDPAIVGDATKFVWAMACGFPAMLAYLALRYVSEGLGQTRPIFIAASLGLLMNILGNWVFMYGHFGMPRLGAVGCGVASAIVMWTLLGTMLLNLKLRAFYKPYALFAHRQWPDATRLKEILRLGLPIGGSVASEGALFVAAALIMGTFGAVQVAAHQVALNYASLMFMVPLALHSATTVHVGHALGAGRVAEARRGGHVGIALCGGLMLVSATVLVFTTQAIAGLYTRDAAVLSLAAQLLLAAAAFQVSDGLQVGAAGALRGFKDARVPMWLNVAAYWGVGFPLAFGLGVVLGWGPLYVWVGLVAGLTVCAALLNWRYEVVSRRAVRSATSSALKEQVA